MHQPPARLLVCALLLLPLLCALSGPALADEGDADPASDSAFQWEAVYKADILQGSNRRIERGRHFLGNLDLKLSWSGHGLDDGQTKVLLHLLNNHGDKTENFIGTAQSISNIETSTSTTKLFQAWVEQGFFDDKASLLFGLLDLNSEFYVTESSALFIHPAFGIGPEFGQTGKNGPSIFPTTSLALRARVGLARAYISAALFDGVPGDPENPRGTHIKFARGDGVLQVVELGVSLADGGLPGKLALGGWNYTARFDDLIDTDAQGKPLRRRNRGAYLLLDYPVWKRDPETGRGVNVFLRSGTATPDVNQFAYAADAGITLRAPFAQRPRDMLGLGLTYERGSSKFRRAAAAAGEPAVDSEMSVELDYRAQVASWLALQPNLQYLRGHGKQFDTSGWVAGIRFELALP